tara:strand:+ start:100 stop:354 length:255 start_codon:yes stop_codon:yes gene_type:complete
MADLTVATRSNSMLKVAPECISAMLESEADAPTQNKVMIQAVNKKKTKWETKYHGVALQVRHYFIVFYRDLFYLCFYFTTESKG